MSFEVIIIGGGLGGLTTGALLAHHGQRVLVLEQHGQLGGRARAEEQNGFLLGAGPSFTPQTTHSPCAEILRKIGQSIPFVETRRPLCWVDRGGRLQPHPLPGIPGTLSRSGLLPWSAMLSTRALHTRVMSMRPEEAWDIPLGIWANSYVRHPATRRFLFETAQFF
ncbi:MAG: NAD(P)-binding protein, partial [Candidatus Latescibacteria bacterium]|nr:NAD(P)-binding protein [Candidatus Latescibacterota bacterium]